CVAKGRRIVSGTQIIISLVGSVALLLWGVRMVRTGMTRAFGPALRRLLGEYGSSRTGALAAGMVTTIILQSSTATALLLASFSSRGLIALPVALAAMLGADIGTSVAAQIFSLDVKWIWTVLIGAGVVIFMSSSNDKTRGIGRIVLGIGLMLLALTHIGTAAEPLRDSATFRSLLSGLAGEPMLGFLVTILITWFAHSSLSIVLLIMSLAATGALPAPLTLALVLGANVGGAIAPLVSLSGSPVGARRVALGNLGMRTALAIPALFAVGPAADLFAMLTADPGRLVVNFHIGFNIAVAMIFLPITGLVAKLTERILPDPAKPADMAKPRHLEVNVLDAPSEALACAMRETLNLGGHVETMLREALVVFEKSDAKLMKEVERTDNTVDSLHEAIKLYLVKVSTGELTEEESRRYVEILTFNTNLEHIGDIIDKNLMELAAKMIKNKYTFSDEGLDDLRKLHGRVMDNMRLAFNVFATRDVALARRLLAEKAAMRNAEVAAADSHYARLREARRESIETSAIHLDVIRDLKRISGHLTSVAYPILETVGEIAESRLRVSDPEESVAQLMTRPRS
ncbi:Na/Pi cotransporter family protein, partial [Pseudorhodoplanes sp.]|uniref:Na/Pi cotransporter family protein n=1 Tax=Pseudorhodoplanes sp. TaxID=1934341 RepID=UPI003D130378